MRRLAALAAALAFALDAHAAPASRDSVDALFKLMKADSVVDGAYAAMEKAMKQMLSQAEQGRTLTPARQKAEEAAMKEMTELVHHELGWSALEPSMIDAYTKTFSQDEIEAMINFYATPAGQAMVAKMPALMQNTMAAMQVRMQALLPRIQEIAQKAAQVQ